jgi:hypothetical protein
MAILVSSGFCKLNKHPMFEASSLAKERST